MPETPKPSNQYNFEKFVKEFNLDPLNNDAIMNCLFTIWERQNELEGLHKGLVDEVYNPKIETLERCKEKISKLENN